MAPRNRKLRVKERRYRTRCPATLLLLANRTPNRGTTVNRVSKLIGGRTPSYMSTPGSESSRIRTRNNGRRPDPTHLSSLSKSGMWKTTSKSGFGCLPGSSFSGSEGFSAKFLDGRLPITHLESSKQTTNSPQTVAHTEKQNKNKMERPVPAGAMPSIRVT